MTQRRLTPALLLLLASPWAAAHPGHGQGLGHLHHSLAQTLAEWPAAVAAVAIALGGLAGWWAWRQDRADRRLQHRLLHSGNDASPDAAPPA